MTRAGDGASIDDSDGARDDGSSTDDEWFCRSERRIAQECRATVSVAISLSASSASPIYGTFGSFPMRERRLECCPKPEADLLPHLAMREKACFVLAAMEQRMAALGFSWADVTATQVYTIFEIHPLLADEFVRRVLVSVQAINAPQSPMRN